MAWMTSVRFCEAVLFESETALWAALYPARVRLRQQTFPSIV
jgi:hypothetical protein